MADSGIGLQVEAVRDHAEDEVAGTARAAEIPSGRPAGRVSERQLLGRSRRANSAGGRQKSYRVYVTEAEDGELRARAEEASVTVPRLLFEAAIAGQGETSTERLAIVAELFRVSRLMASVANNVNQLARFANTEGRFPEDAHEVLGEYRRVASQVEREIERLAGA